MPSTHDGAVRRGCKPEPVPPSIRRVGSVTSAFIPSTQVRFRDHSTCQPLREGWQRDECSPPVGWLRCPSALPSGLPSALPSALPSVSCHQSPSVTATRCVVT